MGDLALAWTDSGADLVFEGGDLATDDSLLTATIISLMSDRRARADDQLPEGGRDRRGFWGDAWAVVPGDQLGSRLWLLGREKELPETVRRAREYAEEGLAWMIKDGIATAVDVVASVPRTGVLLLEVAISRSAGGREQFQFEVLWEALNGL
ncbi:MAG: phage GP46 family protein [Pseudomonas sp.]